MSMSMFSSHCLQNSFMKLLKIYFKLCSFVPLLLSHGALLILIIGQTRINTSFFFAVCISTSSIQAYITLNYRLGDDAILPCDNAPPLDSTCSIVSWFHSRELPWTTEVVHNGNIIEKTAQAARLSLYSNCFLGIKSITLKDSGVYYCRPGDNNALLTTVYLNILTSEYNDLSELDLLVIFRTSY